MLNEPKYLFIKNDLQNKIRTQQFASGSKIPSEAELREQYKVSRHTVRVAISKLVNEGYLTKYQGLGTFVTDVYKNNQIPKTKKTIGVITTYLSDYIFPSIVRGIEEELSKYDYSLMLSSTKNNADNEKASLESMINQNVDGLIIEPTKSNILNQNLNYYLKILEEETPLIMLNASYDELDLPMVALDDIKAGKMATDHLIELGHTNIGMITKSDDLQGKDRFKGYLKSLQENQLSFSNDYIIRFDTESKKHIPSLLKIMLEKDDLPTSFVCYNDEVAILLIKEIQRIGKECPDDFSVVSHDDSFYSTMLPSVKLSTIKHPKEELGRQAARAIINTIENGTPLQSYIFEPSLIKRSSTRSLIDEKKSVTKT